MCIRDSIKGGYLLTLAHLGCQNTKHLPIHRLASGYVVEAAHVLIVLGFWVTIHIMGVVKTVHHAVPIFARRKTDKCQDGMPE